MQGEEQANLLKQYLLGTLNEAETAKLEEAYLADEETLLALQSLRDDLLDDWARGALPADEAQLVTRQIARIPAWRERAAFARTLAMESDSYRSPQPAAVVSGQSLFSRLVSFNWQLGFAFASVILVVAGILGWQWQKTASSPTAPILTVAVTPTPAVTPDNSGALAESPLVQKNEQKSAKTNGSRNADKQVVGLFLPIVTRDRGELPTLVLTPATNVLRLQVELPGAESSALTLNLQNGSGQIVWQRQSLRAHLQGDTTYVTCDVPVSPLEVGEYQVTVRTQAQKVLTQSVFLISRP